MKSFIFHVSLISLLLAWVNEHIPQPTTITHQVLPQKTDSSRIQKALKSFQLEEGLAIELVAAEPLVVDPVAFAFDDQKNLFVIEDRGYPDPIDGSSAPKIGRIALLKDTNNDGQYDKRTEFATGLSYPNGILPWKGGIFVTCAPHIYYFKDTNDDGYADIQEIVLTGFNDDKTAQIRVSHPTLGLDGWVYVTSGLNSGKITSPKHPNRPAVAFTTADGRFHPETFEFQSTGGRSQFGLAFDSFGRRFGTSNRHPVMQMMIEPWHLQRNKALQFTETHQNVSAVEANAKVFPISGAVTTAEFIPALMSKGHTGTFTSASGVLVYNGDGLTPAHKGNVFICESAQNLVQRQIMEEDGVGFTSKLPYEGKEFLSSTDEWFRPVFLQHGPDGALYVADMHRKVIDHPAYVPEESRHLLDFESGKADGRIYRIVSKEKAGTPLNTTPWQFTADKDLVTALLSQNEWQQQTAFQIILSHQKQSIVPKLKELVVSAPLAETRTKAIWLLHHLQHADASLLGQAMQDQSPAVREQVVRIIGSQANTSDELNAIVLRGAQDKHPKVQFHSALALGNTSDTKSVQALAQLAAQRGDDKWIRNAILSGIGDHASLFLQALQSQKNPHVTAYAKVMQDLGQLFGNTASIEEGQKLFQYTVQNKGNIHSRIATVLGLAEGITKRKEFQSVNSSPLVYLNGSNNATLKNFIKQVHTAVLSTSNSVSERKNGLALLSYYNFSDVQTTLAKMLSNQQPADLQVEAVMAVRRFNDPTGARLLTAPTTWSAYTPRVKSAVIAALTSTPVFITELYTALEKGTIQPAEISSTDRTRLLKHKDEAIAKQASAYFSNFESGGRMQVYQEYKALLSSASNSSNGKTVFTTHCSACHSYGNIPGGNVGPDLGGVRNQPADALLLHIVVPNYEMYPAYQTVNIETTDGNTVSGWILAETDNSLTIRTAFSTEVSVLRKNIKQLSNPGISLMPDGLEQAMSKQDMVDLIAFLKGTK